MVEFKLRGNRITVTCQRLRSDFLMRILSGSFALLFGLVYLASPQDASHFIGRVVRLAPMVQGAAPGKESKLLQQGDGVVEDMDVATGKNARVNIIVVGPKRGAVRLAAETRVVFKRWLLNATQGDDIPFKVQIGHFFAAFETHNDDRNTVYIDTPTAHIRLEGTLIDIQVEPDGSSTVYVIEGRATVESVTGGKVVLTAGTSTVVRHGKSPTDPTPRTPSHPCNVPVSLAAAAVDFSFGVQAYYDGNKDLAAGLFEKAVKENPCNGTAYYWLGFTQLKLGHVGQGIELLKKSLEVAKPSEAGKKRVAADIAAAQGGAGQVQALEPPPYAPEIQLP
jgi:hypothetical protein